MPHEPDHVTAAEGLLLAADGITGGPPAVQAAALVAIGHGLLAIVQRMDEANALAIQQEVEYHEAQDACQHPAEEAVFTHSIDAGRVVKRKTCGVCGADLGTVAP